MGAHVFNHLTLTNVVGREEVIVAKRRFGTNKVAGKIGLGSAASVAAGRGE